MPWRKPLVCPAVADGEGNADEQEEQGADWVEENLDWQGPQVNMIDAVEREVEQQVVDDHHDDGDAAQDVDLPEPLPCCAQENQSNE